MAVETRFGQLPLRIMNVLGVKSGVRKEEISYVFALAREMVATFPR